MDLPPRPPVADDFHEGRKLPQKNFWVEDTNVVAIGGQGVSPSRVADGQVHAQRLL